MKTEKEKYKYSVVEKSDNPEENIILQTGLTLKFTLGDITKEVELYNKRKQEIEAKKKISEAVMENIKTNNPGIVEEMKKLGERTVKGIFIYEKANIEVNASNELLKEIDKAIEGNGKELEEIVRQTGIKLKVEKNV